ncbi:MAG: RnfABCDGE type electron transport complex subunit D [Myxococcota bacterium]
MTQQAPRLDLSTAPYVPQTLTTSRVMFEVLAALVPIVAAAVWFFGVAALLMVVVAGIVAMATEWLFSDRKGWGSLRDGTALLTGVLVALTLPPALPLWMVAIGSAVAIALGKLVLGGMGHNLFNPALIGRAFLQAAFPTAITTWTAPGQGFWHLEPSTLAPPMMHVDVMTTATPLGLAKFEHKLTELGPLLLGNTAGSLGETAAILLVVAGVWLGIRRIFDWRLPVSTLGTVAVFSGVLWLFGVSPPPTFMLASGGLLLGAVFMATDPVTTPVTSKGAWWFGFGVGVLVVLIRNFGGLPEGVMYAILLMNAVTPLINRATQPRRLGG